MCSGKPSTRHPRGSHCNQDRELRGRTEREHHLGETAASSVEGLQTFGRCEGPQICRESGKGDHVETLSV